MDPEQSARRAPPVQDPASNLPRNAPSLSRASLNQPLRIPTLRVVSGPNMLQFILLLPEEEVIIGREETGGLALLDASVSRRHARVILQDGHVAVTDLGSTNGTAVTADPAVRGQPIHQAELPMGQWLEIGGVSLRLEAMSLEQLAHLERVGSRLVEPGRERTTGLLQSGWLVTEMDGWMRSQSWREEPVGGLMIELTPPHRQPPPELLAGLCRLLMWKVRSTDACVRHSDRMMWIALPGAHAGQAQRVGERLMREVNAYQWPRSVTVPLSIRFHASEWNRRETAAAWVRRGWSGLVMQAGDPLGRRPAGRTG